MKWRFAALAVLLLVSAPVIPLAHARLDAPRNEVEVYETVVEGDPAAAEGLVLELRLDMGDQLFWEVSHTLRGETMTTSYFSERPVWQYYYSGDEYAGPETWHSLGLYSTQRDEWGYFNQTYEGGGYQPGKLSLVEKDIASRTEEGESHTETVRLRDYYEYYPFDAGYSFYGSTFEEDQLQRQAARDFFRLPVLEDQYVTLTYEREYDGGASLMEFVSESGPFQLSLEGMTTEGDWAYMTLCQKGGESLDYGQIPGGLGIYRAPMVKTDVHSHYASLAPDFTRIEMALPLPEAEALEWFSDSFDGSKLYLITREAGGRMFTVIDLATMTQLQKFSLEEKGPVTDIHNIVLYEDGVLFYVDEEEILYLAADEAGLLSLVLRGDFHTAPPEDVSFEPSYGYRADTGEKELMPPPPTSDVIFNHPAAAWDGARLALLSRGANYDNDSETDCRVHLMVFENDRRQYYGYFDNSLDKRQVWMYHVEVEGRAEYQNYRRDYVSAYRLHWTE